MTENRLTDERLEQLLEVGRAIVSELDPEAVFRRVLDAARDLTGAKYAALGVLNEDKSGLERFVHSGIDEETRREIGPLPRGRGVLGELIRDPRPLRLPDVSAHPRSYGFPPAHPEMRTFLGTPVLVRGEAWGNLYLTEKEGGGEFDETDEQLVVVLAAWSGVAIENARLYAGLDRRAEDLQKALRGLEAASDVARTVSKGIVLDELLDLVVKRGRGVVGARHSMVLLSDGSELEVVAAAGESPEAIVGRRVPDRDTWLNDLQAELPDLRGLPVLVSALGLHGRPRGLLVAFGAPDDEFDANDESVFESFARQRGDHDRHGAGRRGREAPALHGGIRAGAAPVGARAPRRDAAGTWGAQGAAGVLARPGALGAVSRIAQDRHRASSTAAFGTSRA